jgi:hypothetical protein
MFREKAKEEKMKEERNKLPESKVPADIRWDIMYTMRQIMLLIAILIFVPGRRGRPPYHHEFSEQ